MDRNRFAHLSVLLVEDEPDVQELLTGILKDLGARVVSVASAAEALRALRIIVPDIVITDLRLEGDTGFQLLGRLRASDEERLRAVPVIAVTGHSELGHAAATMPFAAWIRKPVAPDVLFEALERALGHPR